MTEDEFRDLGKRYARAKKAFDKVAQERRDAVFTHRSKFHVSQMALWLGASAESLRTTLNREMKNRGIGWYD